MRILIPFELPSDSSVREKLRDFLRFGERDRPLVFEGREQFRSDIAEIVEHRRRTKASDQINSTRVIQGAPGAGKTALLGQISQELANRDTSIVRLIGDELSDTVPLAETFVTAYGKDVSSLSKSYVGSHRLTGDAALIKHEETWQSSNQSVLDQLNNGRSVWSALKKALNPNENHVFVCLIDEAQQLAGTKGKNTPVARLHENKTEGLKIVTVFTGLGDTVAVLESCGLSRLATQPKILGPLSNVEAKNVVLRTLSHQDLGLVGSFTSSHLSDIATHLAFASEGWPRHLHHYIHGLVRELYAALQEGNSAGTINLTKILEHGDNERANYYLDRLIRLDSPGFIDVLIEVVSQNQGTSIFTLADFVEAARNQPNFDPARLDSALQVAMHRGVLERESTIMELYRLPVPSLSTYLRCAGDHVRFLQKMREKHSTFISRWSSE